jgi:hypothetical protein
MRSPGDVLTVGFKLFVVRQWVRLELLANPELPEKDSPAHCAPMRQDLQCADSRWLLGRLVVRHVIRLLLTPVLAKKGECGQGDDCH